jgi:ATPase subunit of ABC transporter with duplicated ATPase domains
MLVKASNLSKSITGKDLFQDLSFIVNEGEKVALIGRNGLGKTTLFRILNGEDKEFQGQIEFQKGIQVILTRQEHFLEESVTALEYILENVPKFNELEAQIRDYETHGEEKVSLQDYCDSLTEFSELGYFELRSKVTQSLADFQLPEEKVNASMTLLSGGEKRFVELVRVMYSGADLALIDEPTNHMDYIGKEQFIEWLKASEQSLFIVSHDRDVLKYVDKIFEIKNKQITTFNGNYDQYIKQNSLRTTSDIAKYEQDLKRIEQLKKQILDLGRRGAKDKAIKIMEDRFKRELERLEESLEKPSFWIDKDSLEDISTKVVDKYHKYKEKNIQIKQTASQNYKKILLDVKHLSLGYTEPLFKDVNFELHYGEKIFIKGRNGAGKSTLIKKILSSIQKTESPSQIFHGEIKLGPSLKVGVYEQEIDKRYLKMTLTQAITELYYHYDIPINNEKINAILKNYLFEPDDGRLTFTSLSGGQKARFQLIKMLVNEPNLLILDEPTNHLDLPSIEELENALLNYHGGIIYISHDSYFIENMGGTVVEIKN